MYERANRWTHDSWRTYNNIGAVLQEEQVGKEKVEVTKLLQRLNVIVRGGPEEGRRLLDALVVSPCPFNDCWDQP